uniref:Peptidase_S8 domain-containing protein n=1 Tax=Steinernema glaseri TaxID=37863 RepID=A0A1I7ZDG8_9BILA
MSHSLIDHAHHEPGIASLFSRLWASDILAGSIIPSHCPINGGSKIATDGDGSSCASDIAVAVSAGYLCGLSDPPPLTVRVRFLGGSCAKKRWTGCSGDCARARPSNARDRFRLLLQRRRTVRRESAGQ